MTLFNLKLNMADKFKNILKQIRSGFYATAGSFIIAAGWSWYHVYKHPRWVFLAKAMLIWLGVYIGYRIFKLIFAYAVKRFRRHEYWQREFVSVMDKLFFVFSLLFGIFFLRNELASIVYASAILLLFFFVFSKLS